MDKLKYIKLENEDGSYSDSIPLAVDSDYVDVNGDTLTTKLGTLATKTEVQAVASGSPLVASSTSGMTDTTRVYVNTTDGHWYWYDGTSWQDGGVYQATGIGDGTVTLASLSNDVKINLNDRINEKDKYNYEKDLPVDFAGNLINYVISSSTGEPSSENPNRITNLTPIYIPYNSYISFDKNTYNYQVGLYLYDKDLTYLKNIDFRFNYKPYFNIPKNAKYFRIYAQKRDNTQPITADDVINNITITFRPIFKTGKNTIGDNLFNINNSLTGYIRDSSHPKELDQTGTYETSEPIYLKANTSYIISHFRRLVLFDTNYDYIANSYIGDETSNYVLTPTSNCYVCFSYNTSWNELFVCEGSSGSYTPYVEQLPSYIQLSNTDNLSDIVYQQNVLYNKKYVALGDSFTHGDFTNAPEDDYHITSGKYTGQLKVYPYIIGNRNLMNVNNLAVNGMTLTNINGESNNYLSNTILANIPSDVDYITIKIGINDNPDHQNAPLGNINDNTDTTFYGSYNRVMTYLINNFKNAKIGIIVSNGMTDINYVNATIDIAKKYGVPYLNETTDNNVPLLIRTLRSDVDTSIKNIRNNEWFVSTSGTTNHHPNAKCHVYESTIVENFIRSL